MAKLAACYEVHSLEKLGTVVVLLGAVLLFCDSSVKKQDAHEVSIFGEIFAILGSIFYAGFFVVNRVIIMKVPGFIIIMFNSVISFVLSIILV